MYLIRTALAALLMFGSPAAWGAAFESHADFLQSLSQNFTPDINNVDKTLVAVMQHLPHEVQIFTTEQYSYFTFTHEGVEYQGNIRIEDKGNPRVFFTYFPRGATWLPDPAGYDKIYEGNSILKIEKTEPFSYRLTVAGIDRIFKQIDVSKENPPAKLLKIDEVFLGQVHDDSGVWFFLVFDKKAKTALYLLNEKHGPVDILVPARNSVDNKWVRLFIGQRTGYVYWQEIEPERKRLVGVYLDNIERNNYFDGPFDQLPDSYSGPMTIKQVFQQVKPNQAKNMDEHGNFINAPGFRASIDAYLAYQSLNEFKPLEKCLDGKNSETHNRKCFKKNIGF
jgi:hypothetical protein